jgi:HK97 family phage major capsid protein/HK97 family phage prohead protease
MNLKVINEPKIDFVPFAMGDTTRSNKGDERGLLFRDATVDPAGLKADTMECRLAFSSEQPVTRMDWETGKLYQEVLSHKSGAVDLSRLNNRHPLLVNHNADDQVGVVKSAQIDADGVGRATVKFSKSARGQEIWQDVKDGIRGLVSVGYRVGKELSRSTKDGLETRSFEWMPYELSLVPIPADTTVGVGRNEEAVPTKPQQNLPHKIMSEENKTPSPDITVLREQANREQLARINEINAIASRLEGRVTDIRKLAADAVSQGVSVDAFRTTALGALPAVQPVQEAPKLDVKPKDFARYSIARAIAGQLSGKLDGFEAEMNQECARVHGRKASGFWVPDEVMARNAVAGTGTLGGMLVQTTNLASEFVEVLRNKSQVLNLGARVLNLTNQVTIPRQNAAATANWVGETVTSTLSGINLTQLTLTPQAISANVQYSKMLLEENNPSIDMLLRDDITNILALAIDLAALHGTGSGQPTGIISTTGIGSVLLATNGLALSNSTAYPAMVSLESTVAAANADNGALAYLMRPGVRGQLKTQTRFANTNTCVFEGGQVNGYRAEVTNQIVNNLTTGTATTITTPVFFGNWNDLLIANFGSTDLVVDPYTAGANGVVRIYARRWVDIGVRHPSSFAILGGVLNG